MKKWWMVTWWMGIGVVISVYFFAIKEAIILAYQGKAPFWFEAVVGIIYPRFIVEKHRFDLAFFLEKADQVVLRFSLINIILSLFLYYYFHSAWFRKKVTGFWATSVSIRQVFWLRILFFSGMFLFSSSFYKFLFVLKKAAVFYNPLLILQLFSIDFPSLEVIIGLYILLLVACTGCIFQVKPVISSIIVAAIFILFQAWLYSFEKIDHTYATLTYAVLLMPFLLIERNKAIKQKSDRQQGWPLQLICLSIALVYLMSGLEKILISGLEWMSPDSFRSYIYLHQAPVGIQMAQYDFLCLLLPAIALLFQFGFIFIIFIPCLKLFFLPMGIGFHAGTYLLFHVGWYFSPWVFVYIFFINWETVAQRIKQVFLHSRSTKQQTIP